MDTIQTLSASEQLDIAKKQLDSLQETLDEIARIDSRVFEAAEFKSTYDAWLVAAREARARLNEPVLSIATIGTTSSGKSTFVNALVGRKIAPIHDDEKSAGILTLVHSKRRQLVIEATEGATWQTGSWEGLSDSDTYSKLDATMSAYREVRRTTECTFPKATIEGPLLPGIWPALLGLPPGVGVEFVDLPGLKSVNDRVNLGIIQERVHKSFCVVVNDYLQLETTSKAAVLGQVKRVSDLMQGRTGSMLFLLNREDQRDEDHADLNARIRATRADIREALGLPTEPDVLPFNSRVLYYIQCAWGPTPLDGPPAHSLEFRSHFLRNFEVNCARELARLRLSNDEAKRFCDEHAGNFARLSDDDLRKFLRDHVQAISHGDEFWRVMRERVRTSFWDLVIAPAVLPARAAFDVVFDRALSLVKIASLDSAAKVGAERAKIQKVHAAVCVEVEKRRDRFRKQLDQAVDLLKEATPTSRNEAAALLGEGFQAVIDGVAEVKADIRSGLLATVQRSFLDGSTTRELVDQLREMIAERLAENVADACEKYVRAGFDVRAARAGLRAKVQESNADAVGSLRTTEKAAKRVYLQMRKAIPARAELLLQARARVIQGALANLLNAEAGVLRGLAEKSGADPMLIEPIVSSGLVYDPEGLRLPDRFVALETPEGSKTTVEKQENGVKARTERYTSGSCFKSTKTRTVYDPVYKSVPHIELELPSADEMLNEWAKAVEAADPQFWSSLGDWIESALAAASDKQLERSHDATRMFEAAFDQRLEELKRKKIEEEEKWKRALELLDSASKTATGLLRPRAET